MRQLFQAALLGRQVSHSGSQKTCILSLMQSQEDLVLLRKLIEDGKVMPVIDGYYPLSKTTDAFWHIEKQHPKGKIVITIEHHVR